MALALLGAMEQAIINVSCFFNICVVFLDSYFRVMMGLRTLRIEEFKEFCDGEKVKLYKNTICSVFYVILAMGLALSIFSIIVNSLLIHGVWKVRKHMNI